MMQDTGTGQAHTAHTLNRVPVLLVNAANRGIRLRDGRLADIAPTLLGLMGLPQPDVMTGRCLIEANASAQARLARG
jgi:2,3-bisphosphoglycerate-independent phosphoglycerate mutase